MGRLVVVSNRVSLPGERPGRAGGLAVAMRDALRRQGGLWFGWSSRIGGDSAEAPQVIEAGRITYVTADLSQRDYDDYYVGYANGTLWPLFHYRLGLIEFRREWFEGYLRVNREMAATLKPFLRDDDVIWVHDYHLIPFAMELRRLGVRNRIGFFLHIPFPAAEVLVSGPCHETLVEALCCYDLVGFQTRNDLRAFADYVVHEAGGRFDPDDGAAACFGRRCQARVFPIGIDTAQFAAGAAAAEAAPETLRLEASLQGRALIIGADRLDYSKGLPNRLDGYARLLDAWPEHRRNVTFLQVTPPSREDVAQYRRLRRELDERAGQINGAYGEFDWQPIRYLCRSFSRNSLAGFYRLSRVGFITPLRDGMNLVAKEYVAAQKPEDPGVLVLSRTAGAARELPAALIVNPFDLDQLARALHQALTMPLDERQMRWRAMMDTLETQTIGAWRAAFLDALATCPASPHAAAGAGPCRLAL